MFVIYHMIIILSPFFPSIYFTFKAYNLYVILNEEEVKKEKELKFNSLKDFLPKNIIFQLKNDLNFKENTINKILRAYRKLLFSIAIYLFWESYTYSIYFIIFMIYVIIGIITYQQIS